MGTKFIPSGDQGLETMATSFAQHLAEEPARYRATPEEVEQIQGAVAAFVEARKQHYGPMHRSKATRMRKDETRAQAVTLIQDAANRIRADRSIDSAAKMLVRVAEKSEKRGKRACPQAAPRLHFVASKSGGWNEPGMHRLMFFDRSKTQTSRAKPDGAVRIELFVDLVAPGEPMPHSPGEHTGGWPRYLRSFSRSPITVQYPKLNGATRIVYWARWANATGEVGRYSQPLVAALDMWTAQPQMLPAPETEAQRIEQRVTVTSAQKQLPMSDAA
ncbi:MAG: hypothetical protein WBD40_13255 [Tepidisphaeraceae bacterium]